MYTLRQTSEFRAWVLGLTDRKAKARIAARLNAAQHGNFGDHKSAGGGGVMEMRIDYGPGYRLYYAQEGRVVYVLLTGGDKSTQAKDIKLAQELWQRIKEQRNG